MVGSCVRALLIVFSLAIVSSETHADSVDRGHYISIVRMMGPCARVFDDYSQRKALADGTRCRALLKASVIDLNNSSMTTSTDARFLGPIAGIRVAMWFDTPFRHVTRHSGKFKRTNSSGLALVPFRWHNNSCYIVPGAHTEDSWALIESGWIGGGGIEDRRYTLRYGKRKLGC